MAAARAEQVLACALTPRPSEQAPWPPNVHTFSGRCSGTSSEARRGGARGRTWVVMLPPPIKEAAETATASMVDGSARRQSRFPRNQKIIKALTQMGPSGGDGKRLTKLDEAVQKRQVRPPGPRPVSDMHACHARAGQHERAERLLVAVGCGGRPPFCVRSCFLRPTHPPTGSIDLGISRADLHPPRGPRKRSLREDVSR